MKTKLNNQKGFTIIEVLIVLAIAGLILLIVFLAVPALQRNSRNTQRKNDVQNMLGAISEYTNNNSGVPPKDQATLTTALENGKYGYYNATPPATYDAGSDGFTNPKDDTATISIGAKCGTGTAAGDAVAGSQRQIAVAYTIENSAGNTKACQES